MGTLTRRVIFVSALLLFSVIFKFANNKSHVSKAQNHQSIYKIIQKRAANAKDNITNTTITSGNTSALWIQPADFDQSFSASNVEDKLS